MKTIFKIFTFTATISFSSTLMAQQSGDIVAPSAHTRKGFTEAYKSEFKVLTEPANDSIGKLPFMNHLPKIVPNENRKLSNSPSQGNPDYDNNMPVVKPGKTSEIPVRKLDAKSPYTYKMPIIKSGRTEND